MRPASQYLGNATVQQVDLAFGGTCVQEIVDLGVLRQVLDGNVSAQYLNERSMPGLSKATHMGNRAYHGSGHACLIADCFQERCSLYDDLDAALLFAAFHDVVQLSGAPPMSSEMASLLVFRTCLKRAPRIVTAQTATRVTEAIIGSALHSRSLDYLSSTAELLLDCDLWGLAEPWEVYFANAQAIREEHALVPDDVFMRGRHAFLTTLLERRRIYYRMDDREGDARRNIQGEMCALERCLENPALPSYLKD